MTKLPLLVALPHWHGEDRQVLELAKFIVALQKANGGPTRQVEFVLINRYDTPKHTEAFEVLSTMFPVFMFENPHKGVGWPAGCNDGAKGAANFTYRGLMSRRRRWGYVLLLESDTFPLVPDWASRLLRFAEARREDVTGIIVKNPGIPTHVNGSLLFRTDLKLVKLLRAMPVPRAVGWDVALYSKLLHFGVVQHPGMKMIYRSIGCSEATVKSWIDDGVVYFHGAKDRSVIDAVEKIYRLERQIPDFGDTVEVAPKPGLV